MKKHTQLGVFIITAVLTLAGCNNDKEKAIKAAQNNIIAITDNIVGIQFYDIEYFPAQDGKSCVRGKYRTDYMRETRFVSIVNEKDGFKASEPFLEDHNNPDLLDPIWEETCS